MKANQTLSHQVNFEMIRYANCWEDADLLLHALDVKPGANILSIASAGDNSLSLLTTQPKKLVAVDISSIQLHLIELKMAAIRELTYENMLGFLGFRPCKNRWEIFQTFQSLSKEAKSYWEGHPIAIQNGVIYAGKIERYFRFFATKLLPLIHSKKRVQALLEEKSPADQAAYFDQKWDTWRWRLVFHLFFNRRVMGRYGRDPRFLDQVKVPVASWQLQKAQKHLSSIYAQDNHFLHFLLTGSFGEKLPHYARKEHFETIRQNLDRLELMQGYAQEALQNGPEFQYLNLSNIFEYMDMPTFREVADAIRAAIPEQAKLAYWNLMAPRKISELFPYAFRTAQHAFTPADLGFFYHQFINETKQ